MLVLALVVRSLSPLFHTSSLPSAPPQATVDVDKELGYVFEAIKETIKRLDGRVPLIGFCGGPVCISL